MYTTMRAYDGQLHEMMAMCNMSLNIATVLSASSYVQAQKVRAWGLQYFRGLFSQQFDVIVTPTCAALPPRFHRPGVDMSQGISDATTVFDAMVFVFLANLLGNPAVSVPNGYDPKTGLPTALQVMADWGCEEDAISVAATVERATPKQQPKTFFNILE